MKLFKLCLVLGLLYCGSSWTTTNNTDNHDTIHSNTWTTHSNTDTSETYKSDKEYIEIHIPHMRCDTRNCNLSIRTKDILQSIYFTFFTITFILVLITNLLFPM
jgi:hypothetical protein